MFGECHAHLIMDGLNYRRAVDLHADGVKDKVIQSRFRLYQELGILFVRDGGDAGMVSKRAKELSGEYGIDYRTPVFAIHRNGHYGGIVGCGFDTLREYHQKVMDAKVLGADFIKIMTTGILDFNDHGKITGQPLDKEEVKEMVHIAHEEGFAVMSHTNGDYGVQAAIEAGADSVEHGNYISEETISMLADSSTVWVPTLVTVRNLMGSGRYDSQILARIAAQGEENLRLAYRAGVKVALGSDGGAYMVPHGWGLMDEYHAFLDILGTLAKVAEIDDWLTKGEKEICERFKRDA